MHERHDSPFPRPNSPRRHAAAWAFCLAASLVAQQPQEPPAGGPPPNFEPGGSSGRGGPGFGPQGGPAAEREQQLVEQFDADKSGKLDDAERKEARAFVKSQPRRGMGGPGGPGGRGGRGGRGGFPGGPPPMGEDAPNAAPRTPKQIAHGDVQSYADKALYDPSVVRTIFLQFPQSDWFDELADFYRTDVELPASMRVDGKDYAGVGVGFRGNSSYFGVQGKKKSFSISVDFTDPKQKLYGYGELNLLNCNDDPSYVREAVHAFVARGYMPALQANLVQVVVNGENWGLYANVQQFDKTYLDESFGTKKGVRFKVPANPRGGAGLAWLGEDKKAYEAAYELKGSLEGEAKDAAWTRLIEACRILNTTPVDQLETALPSVLDVDAALWFLAVDAALLDGDGYASRASDFLLWESPEGRFRPLPYDSNEILSSGGGPGGMRGRRGAAPADGRDGEGPPRDRGQDAGGPPPQEPGAEGARPQRGGRGGPGGMMGAPSATSSPLAIAEQQGRPLGRLLLVPRWRAAYLAHLRAIATQRLDWSALGPFVQGLQGAADAMAKDDDKSLFGYAAFQSSVAALQRTSTTRQKAILEHASMQGDWPAITDARAIASQQGEQATLALSARITAPSNIASAWLHIAAARRGPFAAVRMHDDGKHGDGEANDGVFGATSPAFAQGETVHWYVEAQLAGDEPHAAFWPEASSCGAARAELPGSKGKSK